MSRHNHIYLVFNQGGSLQRPQKQGRLERIEIIIDREHRLLSTG